MQVMWHPSGPGTASGEALRHHLTSLAYVDAQVGRLCPQCGSEAHGRPWARADGVRVEVSVSRSGPHLLTAVSGGAGGPGTGTGAIGVDVESVEAVAARWDPGVVLAPGEGADVGATAEERAAIWVAKEAVLKAWGVGLARPMTSFRLADLAGSVELTQLPAPPGYAAAVALIRR